MKKSDVNEGRINDQMGTQLESLSAQIEASVARGRNSLSEWRALIGEKTSRASSAVDRYAHEQPWQMVCGACLLGIGMGLCLGSRR